MRKVVYQCRITDKYTILQLDGPIPLDAFHQYSIDGTTYDPVALYDVPNGIAIRETGHFVGKTVEFI